MKPPRKPLFAACWFLPVCSLTLRCGPDTRADSKDCTARVEWQCKNNNNGVQRRWKRDSENSLMMLPALFPLLDGLVMAGCLSPSRRCLKQPARSVWRPCYCRVLQFVTVAACLQSMAAMLLPCTAVCPYKNLPAVQFVTIEICLQSMAAMLLPCTAVCHRNLPAVHSRHVTAVYCSLSLQKFACSPVCHYRNLPAVHGGNVTAVYCSLS